MAATRRVHRVQGTWGGMICWIALTGMHACVRHYELGGTLEDKPLCLFRLLHAIWNMSVVWGISQSLSRGSEGVCVRGLAALARKSVAGAAAAVVI